VNRTGDRPGAAQSGRPGVSSGHRDRGPRRRSIPAVQIGATRPGDERSRTVRHVTRAAPAHRSGHPQAPNRRRRRRPPGLVEGREVKMGQNARGGLSTWHSERNPPPVSVRLPREPPLWAGGFPGASPPKRGVAVPDSVPQQRTQRGAAPPLGLPQQKNPSRRGAVTPPPDSEISHVVQRAYLGAVPNLRDLQNEAGRLREADDPLEPRPDGMAGLTYPRFDYPCFPRRNQVETCGPLRVR